MTSILKSLFACAVLASPLACSSSGEAGPTDVPAAAVVPPANTDGGFPPDTRAVLTATVKQKYDGAPSSRAIAVPVAIVSPDDPSQTVTLDLMLDTGSSGISVFAASLGELSLRRVGAKRSVTYGGGDVYEQQSAEAVVGLGGILTDHPIHVAVVDDVHCSADWPDCAGAAGPSYFTKMGFHGILGIGTRVQGDVYSPMVQLPENVARRYALDTKSGQLIVGATDDDTAGFATYPLAARGTHPNGARAFDDSSLPLCVSVGSAVANDCASGLLDTGVQWLFFAGVKWGDAVEGTGLAPGATLGISLGGVFEWKEVPTEMLYVSPRPFLGGYSRILGMTFFETYDVLYDLDRGALGVRLATPSSR